MLGNVLPMAETIPDFTAHPKYQLAPPKARATAPPFGEYAPSYLTLRVLTLLPIISVAPKTRAGPTPRPVVRAEPSTSTGRPDVSILDQAPYHVFPFHPSPTVESSTLPAAMDEGKPVQLCLPSVQCMSNMFA